jgi:PAS domain S-box-containing protein
MTKPSIDQLRQSAEKRLKDKQALTSDLSESETLKLLHELQVHQIELEMINESLKEAIDSENRALYRYTELFDFAPIGYFVLDPSSRIKQVNLRGASLLGLERLNLMGRLFSNYISKEYRATFSNCMAKALDCNQKQSCEILVKVDKQNLWISLEANMEMSSTDYLVAMTDITERKETAAQIIQSSKLATLGEMATSVAHELNQPLNVIRMAAWNSRKMISNGSADPEYLNKKLERIEEQTARAAAIIDHMRMFGRDAKESPEPLDPRNAVSNVLDLMGEQLRLAEIKIKTEFSEECSPVLGHIIQIEQVILNLLTNARDAMYDSDYEAKITLRVFENDDGVHIETEDTGGGIPKDILSRIFEPFYTTKDIGKGTGLGLSVSYGIVRGMNGIITAENTDKGVCFKIILPIIN